MGKVKRPAVVEFQNKIIILLESKVAPEIIIQIKQTDSKRQIRKIIGKLTEYHDLLRENKIRIYQDSNKKKKKKKIDFKGAEFDRTISSVRTVYTPMGNKR